MWSKKVATKGSQDMIINKKLLSPANLVHYYIPVASPVQYLHTPIPYTVRCSLSVYTKHYNHCMDWTIAI